MPLWQKTIVLIELRCMSGSLSRDVSILDVAGMNLAAGADINYLIKRVKNIITILTKRVGLT